ncbi:hypothetical protein [Streptomyces sp. NPDC046939]|uniref:hypothetical protein n=1 Tax=Streptomyces sp. NPDC046939 TaxID=3155376 RepID=UPI0033DAE656
MVVAARGLGPLPLFVAAVVLTVSGPAPAVAAPRQAACEAATGSHEFPVRAVMRDGPDTYRPGGQRQSWAIGLTNATRATCGALHPVLVLVAGKRALRPEQIRLDFSGPTGHRSVPIPFERTDHRENVGVFDKHGPGLTLGPGETVTVRVRLAFTADTRPDRVVASAALVHRRTADDGDWVGQSRDYRFTIVPGNGDGEASASLPDATHHRDAPRDPGSRRTDELAATGPAGPAAGPSDALLRRLGTLAACLVTAGAALMLGSRRRGRAGR